ncbi:MAG: hypothetical protein IPO26_19250 [Saprospiraceae bacterium]|nr:hypothetical protein [Saprospiraceae bacterium]
MFNGWNSFHIPLSGFANLRSRAQIAQLILSGLPTGHGTLYVDNVYFTTFSTYSRNASTCYNFHNGNFRLVKSMMELFVLEQQQL